MSNNTRWWGLRRNQATTAQPPNPTTAQQTVDTELVIQAARLAVTTRVATLAAFVTQPEVTAEVAEQLLARLEHCGVLGPVQPDRRRPVLTTAGQLPSVIEDFRRRG
ncbi:hypothetical protein [Curtobacterium sp. ISL-83]|uniref:hypothetical protein n=1 Tax=Curtobacterium sp. ISL-83 TaxID=2819145 RepID=UPI001BE610A4|nr:hypothetical protein [Curtobacterium sp. ISL-83]MBT2501681.1 hypothetical protein [Curtobacterium sp. ISL-83]